MGLLTRLRSEKILPIRHYGDPVLKLRSAEIEMVDDEIRDLARRMIRSMHEHNGVGLAAPQVGRSIRLVTVDVPMERDEDDPWTQITEGEAQLAGRMPLALVNPVLSDFEGPEICSAEGCLSVPGFSAHVRRPEFCVLDSDLVDGSHVHFRVGGLLCRCLQHEIDHLNGRLFIEVAVPEEIATLKPELDALRQQTRQTLKKSKRR